MVAAGQGRRRSARAGDRQSARSGRHPRCDVASTSARAHTSQAHRRPEACNCKGPRAVLGTVAGLEGPPHDPRLEDDVDVSALHKLAGV